ILRGTPQTSIKKPPSCCEIGNDARSTEFLTLKLGGLQVLRLSGMEGRFTRPCRLRQSQTSERAQKRCPYQYNTWQTSKKLERAFPPLNILADLLGESKVPYLMNVFKFDP
ncbi:MAG: hypothetical protein ACRC12_00550, partial [Holosporales bacterium]